jgi:ATP-binding cassette subfamily F protein uup
MAVLVTCQGLDKSYHARPLFNGLTIGVADGDRIGVIGPNGAGKSTLLRIVAGLEEPDAGTVATRRNVKTAYVPQTQEFPADKSCTEIVAAVARAGGKTPDEAQLAAERVLSQIGFTDPAVHATTLSGGWRKRLSIACGLVQEPDLLLLDEPTNHLDLEGILWLEKLLAQSRFAWMMVSHDRYMLERTVTKVAEVSRVYPDGVYLAEGRYSDFLAKRQEYLLQQAKIEETLANKVRREVEWLRRGPQARTTKAKARIDEAHALIDELSELKGRLKTGETRIDFSASGRKTKRLIVAEGLSKSLGGRKLFSDLDLVLAPGMSLGLLGGNGTGKSTILKLLAGQLDPDTGTVTPADGLRIVVFDQNRESLDPTKTLKATLCEHGDSVIYRDRQVHIITWAKRFQFKPEQLNLLVGELSGGEQARALIARLMLAPADVLLLDEPTNDLDIPTLEVLEESLEDFPGALVLVTHDRYLMGRVCNMVLGLDGRGGSRLYADFEQWEREMAQAAKAERADAKESKERADKASAATAAAPSASKSSKKLSYMEQREYDQMEGLILAAETTLEEKRAIAEDPAIAANSARLTVACDELRAAQSKVDTLYARWAELEAKVASAPT